MDGGRRGNADALDPLAKAAHRVDPGGALGHQAAPGGAVGLPERFNLRAERTETHRAAHGGHELLFLLLFARCALADGLDDGDLVRLNQ